jgi:hypothetical protein
MDVRREDDTYTITARASGLPNGSHWFGGLGEGSLTDPDANEQADLDTRAHAGAWSVEVTVPALESPDFDVVAFGQKKIDIEHGRLCSVYASPAKPFGGVTFCHKTIMLALVSVYRPGVGVVVRWAIGAPRADSQRTITVAAQSGGTGTAEASRRTATHRYFIMGKTIFTGLVNPSLKLSVLADGGQRCAVGMRRVLGSTPPSAASLVAGLHRKTAESMISRLHALARRQLR